MYHYFFIHPFVNGHLGCFHLLAIVNSAAVNKGIHVSFSILVSSGCISRSGIGGSYGGFIPNFLRNLHTIFHSGCINLHSLRQCKNVPFSPHPLQHLLFVDFFFSFIFISWRLITLQYCVCRLFDDGYSDGQRRQWHPTPVFLPGEFQGQGSLVGCRLWGLTESDTREVT